MRRFRTFMLGNYAKHSKPFFLACWYRPPKSGNDTRSFENLRNLLSILDEEEKEIILIGDANCDFKNNTKHPNTKSLRSIHRELQLTQLVKDYTRVAIVQAGENNTRTTKSLIDHFSCNKPNLIIKRDVLETGMVDHYLVYGIRKIGTKKLQWKNPKYVETRNLKKYNKLAFQYDLQKINWEQILFPLYHEPSEMVQLFQEISETNLEIYAPLKKFRVRDEHAPWLSPSLRDLIRRRNRAKWEAVGKPELWPEYKLLRNETTNEVNKAIEGYYNG